MIHKTREEMLKILGENLRARRLAINISQKIAADRSGISLKAVRNLELGENASTLSLLSYCRTLGKADWLMTIAPPETDESMPEEGESGKKRKRASRIPKQTHLR